MTKSISDLKVELAALEASLAKLASDTAAVERGQVESAQEMEAANASLASAEQAYDEATCFEPGSPKEVAARSALAAARERQALATDRAQAFARQAGQFYSKRFDSLGSEISGQIYKKQLEIWAAVGQKELEALPKETITVLHRAFAASPFFNFEQFLRDTFSPNGPTEESWKSMKETMKKKYGI